MTQKQNQEILIYKSKDGKIKLEAKLDHETIWLNQKQITELFNVDRTVITKHINNIIKEGELEEKSNVQKMHITNSDKPVKLYKLDMIISIGYRVNSKKATQFRIWATSVLKDHIVKGYSVNQKRLEETGIAELTRTIDFIKNSLKTKSLSSDESQGILKIISDYANSFGLLKKYDDGFLEKTKTRKSKTAIDYEEAIISIALLKKNLLSKKEASALFGMEREHHLKSILANLYQSFGGQELYSSLEEKAANLLYLVIKDHPFTDGNKRIGTFLFLFFLEKNQILFKENGEKRFDENSLVALALLIAQSNPKEKEIMIKLVMNLMA